MAMMVTLGMGTRESSRVGERFWRSTDGYAGHYVGALCLYRDKELLEDGVPGTERSLVYLSVLAGAVKTGF